MTKHMRHIGAALLVAASFGTSAYAQADGKKVVLLTGPLEDWLMGTFSKQFNGDVHIALPVSPGAGSPH